jgi:hypothetical protein
MELMPLQVLPVFDHSVVELGLGMPAFQYRELLPERQILQEQVLAWAKAATNTPNQSRKKRNMDNSHSRWRVEESVQAVDFRAGQYYGERQPSPFTTKATIEADRPPVRSKVR